MRTHSSTSAAERQSANRMLWKPDPIAREARKPRGSNRCSTGFSGRLIGVAATKPLHTGTTQGQRAQQGQEAGHLEGAQDQADSFQWVVGSLVGLLDSIPT